MLLVQRLLTNAQALTWVPSAAVGSRELPNVTRQLFSLPKGWRLAQVLPLGARAPL